MFPGHFLHMSPSPHFGWPSAVGQAHSCLLSWKPGIYWLVCLYRKTFYCQTQHIPRKGIKQLSKSQAGTLTGHPQTLTSQRCSRPVLAGITAWRWFPCPCSATEPHSRLCQEKGRAGERPQAQSLAAVCPLCAEWTPHPESCLLRPQRAPVCPAHRRTRATCTPLWAA